jgi:nicotinamide riboside kinase
MKQITVVGGAYSVGKSTLIQEIQNKHPDTVQYIPDFARVLLEQRGGIEHVQGQGAEALRDFQLEVMEEYIRAEQQALRQNKPILSDGSLVEVLAYSQGVLDQNTLNILHNLVRMRSQIYQIIHLRPHPDLFEGDGIRHTDVAFQRIIDKRIQDIAMVHNVPRFSVSTTDLQQRYNIALFSLLHNHETE